MGSAVNDLRRLLPVALVAVGLFTVIAAYFVPGQTEDRLLVPKEPVGTSAPIVPTEDIVLVEEIKSKVMPSDNDNQGLADRAVRAKQAELAERQLKEQLSARLTEGVSIPTDGTGTGSQGMGTTGSSQSVIVRDVSEYEKLVTEMYDWLGVKYVWGGTTKKGADCSGFVQSVYRAIGYGDVPRVSRDQSKHGLLVDRKSLMLGDLLFFDTRNARNHSDVKTPSEELQNAVDIELGEAPNVVSHVGVYIGNGVMLHASSGDGYVTFANLESNYYRTRFINARRIIGGTQD